MESYNCQEEPSTQQAEAINVRKVLNISSAKVTEESTFSNKTRVPLNNNMGNYTTTECLKMDSAANCSGIT